MLAPCYANTSIPLTTCLLRPPPLRKDSNVFLFDQGLVVAHAHGYSGGILLLDFRSAQSPHQTGMKCIKVLRNLPGIKCNQGLTAISPHSASVLRRNQDVSHPLRAYTTGYSVRCHAMRQSGENQAHSGSVEKCAVWPAG